MPNNLRYDKSIIYPPKSEGKPVAIEKLPQGEFIPSTSEPCNKDFRSSILVVGDWEFI